MLTPFLRGICLLCPLCAATACTRAALRSKACSPLRRPSLLRRCPSPRACLVARVQVKYGTRPSAGAFGIFSHLIVFPPRPAPHTSLFCCTSARTLPSSPPCADGTLRARVCVSLFPCASHGCCVFLLRTSSGSVLKEQLRQKLTDLKELLKDELIEEDYSSRRRSSRPTSERHSEETRNDSESTWSCCMHAEYSVTMMTEGC